MSDPVVEWTEARARVRDLVSDLSPEQASTRVPACPDWTVRDLLSHMVGLGADVVSGDEDDDHNPGWTQAQVDSRVDFDVRALLEEWDGIAPQLLAVMHRDGPRPLNDIIIHEQDLRGALGHTGSHATDGLRFVRDAMLTRFAAAVDGLPAVELRAADTDWSWRSGDAPEVVLEAPEFDLFRAITTRRSEAQLRAWTKKGDVTGHLAAFAGLGSLPAADLVE